MIFFPQISAKLVEFSLGKCIFHNNSSKTSVWKILNPSTKKKNGGFIIIIILPKRHIFYTLKYVFPMIFFQKSSQMKKYLPPKKSLVTSSNPLVLMPGGGEGPILQYITVSGGRLQHLVDHILWHNLLVMIIHTLVIIMMKMFCWKCSFLLKQPF